MTAIAPQQMRDLADEAYDMKRLNLTLPRMLRGSLADIETTLRAAADLVEAQQRALTAAQQYQIGTEVTDAIAAALTIEPQQETT